MGHCCSIICEAGRSGPGPSDFPVTAHPLRHACVPTLPTPGPTLVLLAVPCLALCLCRALFLLHSAGTLGVLRIWYSRHS